MGIAGCGCVWAVDFFHEREIDLKDRCPENGVLATELSLRLRDKEFLRIVFRKMISLRKCEIIIFCKVARERSRVLCFYGPMFRQSRRIHEHFSYKNLPLLSTFFQLSIVSLVWILFRIKFISWWYQRGCWKYGINIYNNNQSPILCLTWFQQ